MADIPETRYARARDGVHIAYQVVGDGPRDLVMVPGFISHVEALWDDSAMAYCMRRLASFSRLILFDKRGTGLSDRTERLPDLDQRMEDVTAVMDAAGCQQAALLGVSEGGPMAVLFAATYPARTIALVLYGTYARFLEADDYPVGLSRELLDRFADRLVEQWGTAVGLRGWAPSVSHDPRQRESWARFQRLAASPGAARALLTGYADIDVRHVLPSVSVPTLVLHRAGERMVPVESGRDLASRIPGARFVELPGHDHFFWTEGPELFLEEIEEFLTGTRPAPEPDRVLATVLFNDIVGSTERLSEVGDARWKSVLDDYHRMIVRQVGRVRGQLVASTGDGAVATFDGPARAVRCAAAITDGAQALGLEVRSGLHTGEIELRGEDVSGIAVHLAQRVCDQADPNGVMVSRTVVDLVAGSGLDFEDRGDHNLKGVPGDWRLFAVRA